MPHINRIRVNNVKYNFGTQYYDDFVMRFSGKNTIYDLANGGGKSLLMLLLLQNLIPNCTLDEKQPIEKLFRSNLNQTIHSLVEWKLNGNDIQNGYSYMTTGFCARKGKERAEETEHKDTAAVEYFNYVIFYRTFNDNDIRNLPLSDGKERITFQGLKTYLKELEKKDFSLIVKVFERKGDYQRFISNYGLYESEWEIIRGINKTEGHVRTYFETNYRTTKKVVEDLLIEEIIQKSYQNKTGSDEDSGDFAKTLLDIKDKLVELTRRKSDINQYDYQIEVLENFIGRMNHLKGLYRQKEGLKQELVCIYNTCAEREKLSEKQKKEYLHKIEALEKQKKELTAKIETAQIQMEEEELNILEAEVKSTKESLSGFEQRFEEANKRLLLRENANDYLEYLENNKKYETAKIALETVSGDHEEILEDLYRLCHYMKNFMQEEKEEYQKILLHVSRELEDIQVKFDADEEECRSIGNELAVKEHQIGALKIENKELEQEMEELRSRTNLLLLDHAGTELDKNLRDRQEMKNSLVRKQQMQEELKMQETNSRIKQSGLEIQERTLLESLESAGAYLNECGKKKAHADKLKEIYNETDMERLSLVIEHSYRQNVEEIARYKAKKDEKEIQIEAMRQGMPMAVPENLEKLMDYVNRYHNAEAVLGMEFVRKLPREERERILNDIPMLPYAVIMHKNYKNLMTDMNLRKKDFGSYAIPILPAEALESDQELINPSEFMFISKDRDLFVDEEKLKDRCREEEKELQELERQIAKMKEHGRIMKADIAYLQELHTLYGERYRQEAENYEACKQKLKEVKQEKEKLEGDFLQRSKTLQELKEKAARQEKQIKEQEKEEESLKMICSLYGKYNENEAIIRNYESEQLTLRSKLEEAWNKLELKKNRKKHFKEKQDSIKEALTKLAEDWSNNYESYEKEGIYPETTLNKEAVEINFKGKKAAYEQENTDAEDKRRLMETYRAAAEKNIRAIQYRGGVIEELSILESNHSLVRTSMEELLAKKEELLELKESITVAKNQLEASSESANRKFGGIEHGKTILQEKYGFYEPLALSFEKLRLFAEENKMVLQEMDNGIREAQTKLKELESNGYALLTMKEELGHMLSSMGLAKSTSKGTLEYGISLKEKYSKIREQHARAAKEEYERRELFERDKEKLTEMLRKMNASELADEIERSVETPSNESDVESLIENLKNTISCINLEKISIEQGIEDMERIKRNFESQCIQSCMNIKTALDRLPKLSKINLDGQMVSIITLQIPYIKEELYQDAMSNYINEIVENADSFESAAERVKYIKNKLAWKKLFSVIVTDMNSIRLNLYKRERIKEQSRYLKYEEAVGSTGQSQGIYIQFLVAVINYITSMNSANADPMQLKKTIFIDNPFGAAKDVYIWEPIFKLLKANNVQLIVPARGATPAITGRFEVNYILGQKLIDGKQQTVVVDYRSQIEEEVTEYERLSFEQEEFSLLL